MKQEQNELCYPVKTIKFRTCVELYKKWKVTKLRYKTAPSNGIEVEVEYADTLELINPDLESNFEEMQNLNTKASELQTIQCFPLTADVGANQKYKPLTALCLHGAPGCHKDYQHLIKYFIKRNVRVIAPKFPNYGLTKKTLFCHSSAEKAEYIKDFLEAINVNRIDLLLCHSSGLFVAARLINDALNAFGIDTEKEECKKCKKNKKCDECEKVKQEEAKISDVPESTDDEDEELLKDLDERLKNIGKFNDEREKEKSDIVKAKKNVELDKKIGDNKENIKIDQKETEPAKELKQEEAKQQEVKQTVEQKEDKKEDKKENKKEDKKEGENQVASLNEDEGYQEASSNDEQVKSGQQKFARRQFSVSTCEKSKIYFGSLILINVVSHKRSKLLNPVLKNSLYEPSAFFYQLKISRSVVRFCGKIYLDIFGSPVDYNNFDNTILTLTTVLRSNIKSLRQQLERITKTNLPILMFFSENDRLITKGQSYELANFLNVNYIQRDFSDASHHNYDVFNYNSKKKPKADNVEVNNNNPNELNQEAQLELQSTASSDEYDSLRHNESEVESDASSTKNSSSSTDGSLKGARSSENELRSKELDTCDENAVLPDKIVANNEQSSVLTQVKYPYCVSIKKGRHYSHITHSHVMDEHIAKLITMLNLKEN